ncbi:hypothetical protein P280DRAFT_282902 [Massarina eburnea CBS 473.64]|uniref:Uncharacterized protein n=1 Tax=Massarina eburnea CBS 473.64 TaxID=1395130 RepID=A0A6A6S1H9_9PLEO|nr:hypothetical protein P280DRAFT_282902 [Massarina eburnea CBS 473.64]
MERCLWRVTNDETIELEYFHHPLLHLRRLFHYLDASGRTATCALQTLRLAISSVLTETWGPDQRLWDNEEPAHLLIYAFFNINSFYPLRLHGWRPLSLFPRYLDGKLSLEALGDTSGYAICRKHDPSIWVGGGCGFFTGIIFSLVFTSKLLRLYEDWSSGHFTGETFFLPHEDHEDGWLGSEAFSRLFIDEST